MLNPEKAGQHDLEALQELVEEYPYFQAGHLLIAKITGDSAHIKRAAAYTSERAVLMRVINSEFNPDVNLPDIDHLEIGNDDLSLFDKLGKEDNGEEEVDLKVDSDFDDDFPDFSDDLIITGEEEKEEDVAEVIEEIPTEEIPVVVDLDVEETDLEETTETEESTADTISIELPIDSSEEDLSLGYEEEEEEEEDDLMDELAELKRLQAEMEQNRKEAEEAMQAEEDKELAESAALEVEEPEVNNNELETPLAIVDEQEEEESENITTGGISFDDTIFDYPDYEFKGGTESPVTTDEKPETSAEDSSEEENTSAIAEKVDELTETEIPPIPIILDVEPEEEDEEDTNLPADDLSFFEEKEEEEEDLSMADTDTEKDEEAISELLIEDETEEMEMPSIFNFDDDDALFDLDALLEEESQRIDPIKELEKKPMASIELGDVSPNEHAKQSTLISEFIEKSPSIKIPKDAFDQTLKEENDLAEESFYVDPSLVSENLATIYVKQRKYKKAIDIYQQLILKYPDKKAYFANLIENLENK